MDGPGTPVVDVVVVVEEEEVVVVACSIRHNPCTQTLVDGEGWDN